MAPKPTLVRLLLTLLTMILLGRGASAQEPGGTLGASCTGTEQCAAGLECYSRYFTGSAFPYEPDFGVGFMLASSAAGISS